MTRTGLGQDRQACTREATQPLPQPLAGFWGGSADLAPSNMTLMKQFGDFQKGQYAERNLRFGVREHGMGAISNGIALHDPGQIPYCATFFIFTGAALLHCCRTEEDNRSSCRLP